MIALTLPCRSVLGQEAPDAEPAEAALEAPILNGQITQPEVTHPGQAIPSTVSAGGDLSLSIPVMTVPGRGISVPITLSYSSGISVRSQASWVGLGWSYDPGSITRNVVGAIYTRLEGGKFNNVDVFDNYDINHVNPDGGNVLIGGGDWAPDSYHVKLQDRGGSFSQANNPNKNCTLCLPVIREGDFHMMKGENWKIDAYAAENVTVKGEITSSLDESEWMTKPDYYRFVVTDEVGKRFVFEAPTIGSYIGLRDIEYAKPMQQHYVASWRLIAILGSNYSGSLPYRGAGPYGGSGQYTGDNAWPSDNDSGDWVRFEYTEVQSVRSHNGAGGLPVLLQARRLSRIVTPTHIAKFKSNAFSIDYSNPYNMWGSSSLNEIELLNRTDQGDVSVSKVGFIYGSMGRGVNGSRRLDRIVKRSNTYNDTEEYYFNYYNENVINNGSYKIYKLRSSSSFMESTVVDQFGYFSILDGDDILNPWSWSLKKITYPYGGSETYYYEEDEIENMTIYYRDAKFPLRTTGGNIDEYDENRRDYTLINAYDVSQGGPRVRSIVQNDGYSSSVQIIYNYGRGVLSGIPPMYWPSQFPISEGITFSGTYEESSVYYEYIEEVRSDGGVIKTHYSLGEHDSEDIRYLKQGSGKAFVSVLSNPESGIWGVPHKVEIIGGNGIVFHIIEKNIDFVANHNGSGGSSQSLVRLFPDYPWDGANEFFKMFSDRINTIIRSETTKKMN